MAGLVKLKDEFDIAWGNDPDADRHGIVTRSSGLMNPNHYLAVAIGYLLDTGRSGRASVGGRENPGQQQPDRPRGGRSGAHACGKCRWDSNGLRRGCSTGRAASGAKRARARVSCGGTARVWTTDKDGLILGSAGGGDHGGDGQRSGRALPATDGALWRRRITRESTRRRAWNRRTHLRS